MGWVGLVRVGSTFFSFSWVGSTSESTKNLKKIVLMHLKHG